MVMRTGVLWWSSRVSGTLEGASWVQRRYEEEARTRERTRPLLPLGGEEGRWTECLRSAYRWRVQNQGPVGTSLLISCQPRQGSGLGQCVCEQQTDPSKGGKLESEGHGDLSTKGSGFQKRKGAGSPLSGRLVFN